MTGSSSLNCLLVLTIIVLGELTAGAKSKSGRYKRTCTLYWEEYFYDKVSEKCELKGYSSCRGGKGYKTEQLCLDSVKPSSNQKCKIRPETSSSSLTASGQRTQRACLAIPTIYFYFDSHSGKCVKTAISCARPAPSYGYYTDSDCECACMNICKN